LKVFLASSSEEEEDVEAKQARIRKKYSALLQEIKPQEEVRAVERLSLEQDADFFRRRRKILKSPSLQACKTTLAAS
jgi:hypothetical protein